MFRINGELWRVVFCSPHAPELRRSDGAYTLGACNDRTKRIYIRNDLREKFYAMKSLTPQCSVIIFT